jgi:aryl carrier-like protein
VTDTVRIINNKYSSVAIHDAVNQPIFSESAFSIYLVSTSSNLNHSRLAAGFLSQQLCNVATSLKVGLCPIGGLSTTLVSENLQLEPQQVLLHCLLGGKLASTTQQPESAFANQSQVRKDVQGISTDALISYLRGKLPEYMVPQQYLFLDKLPLNANGKIDRSALRKLSESQVTEGGRKIVAPRTELERKLHSIWKDVLQIEEIGVDDDIFALGGDSIKSIQIVSRINKAGIWVTLKQVLQSLTIAKLAEVIASSDSLQKKAQQQKLPFMAINSDKRFEPFPVTTIQQAYLLGRMDVFELGNNPTHSYSELQVENLDTNQLRDSIQTMIEAHPMLRAVFDVENGTQRVLKDVPRYAVQAHDLSQLDAPSKQQQLLEIR